MGSVRAAAFLDVQAFLDEAADATTRKDFDGHLDLIDLPYVVMTATETRLYVDREQMRGLFRYFLAGIEALGFEGVRYSLLRAEPLGRDLVSAIYETTMLGGRRVVMTPYRSTILIRRQPDRWRAVSNALAIGHSDWLDRLMAPGAMKKK